MERSGTSVTGLPDVAGVRSGERPMPHENAAMKARRLLTEGRVTITRVDGAETPEGRCVRSVLDVPTVDVDMSHRFAVEDPSLQVLPFRRALDPVAFDPDAMATPRLGIQVDEVADHFVDSIEYAHKRVAGSDLPGQGDPRLISVGDDPGSPTAALHQDRAWVVVGHGDATEDHRTDQDGDPGPSTHVGIIGSGTVRMTPGVLLRRAEPRALLQSERSARAGGNYRREP